jgi:hypothetical protein
MDYSFLVGVHHKEMGDAVDMTAFRPPPHVAQQAQRGSFEEEEEYDERGRRMPVLRRDDGGVQGSDPNEVTCGA